MLLIIILKHLQLSDFVIAQKLEFLTTYLLYKSIRSASHFPKEALQFEILMRLGLTCYILLNTQNTVNIKCVRGRITE